MSLPLLNDDRLKIAGSDLITHGSTILNVFELEQPDAPRIRNTEVSGLDRGRPEVPAMDPRTVTLAGHIVGEVDLAMPTAAAHSDPKIGVRTNWRSIEAIFAAQFSAATLVAQWQRRTATGWDTFTADVQVANWQVTSAWPTDLAYSVEVTRFSDWTAV
ncbi:MAG: hypothetical protein ACK5O2_00575 [Microthrixaceae bacterium]